jgi:hypothetical protein
MAKLAPLLACVLAFGCTLAMAQKRTIPSRSSGANSGSNCGPVLPKANGTQKGTTANCSPGSNGSNLPTKGSIVGRLLNQELGKAAPRPGTPDFLPSSITVSGNQLP